MYDDRFCAVCGEMIGKGSGLRLGNGENVCKDCADQDCRKCAKCGALFRDIGMVMVKRKWYCRNCADELLGE